MDGSRLCGEAAHWGAPLVGVGLDAVCSSCVDDVYQREISNASGIFNHVVESIDYAALRRLNMWLDEQGILYGTYPYETLLRALAAHSLSQGCSIDELLAKIARAKNADFLFANFNQ